MHACAPDQPAPADGKSGKWLVFVPVRYIDHYWRVIKEAVEEGTLGPAAKVATARPNEHAVDPTRRPIVVYTTDWQDRDDLRRVLRELRTRGVGWRLAFKTDEDTNAGIYGRNTGVYVSPSGSSDFTYRATARPGHAGR